MGPGDLAQALCGLELIPHEDLLVGVDSADDAGVFKLTEDIALVQTVDFFTPIVDDPFCFGQIAVANALSDVYAMGGTPLTALNLVSFPTATMDLEVLREILRGGLDKMREAGVVLVGGHSIVDPELKYGCAITGTVHPQQVLTNKGSRPGDRLILTKPLGTGIVNTAVKGHKASPEVLAPVVASMCALNRQAAEVLTEQEVHACTDVTGFGLIGHAWEMIEGSGCGLLLYANQVPLFAGALSFARQGLKPGGLKRNQDFHGPMVDADPSLAPHLLEVLFDPQTSGGLLAAVPAAAAAELVRQMHQQGMPEAAIIGEVVLQSPPRIKVQ